ncbi:hypothetical protein [Ammoniphilus sp. YIM 78166]|uniref:hypothetical protein n=1 Tax=Ammoniphilus sp. YIM 78166 TaxID=1644106 RepID=UPI00106F6F1D|nr:hypothetical protein [Ammoniphilus sp. YIM 78166]
MDLFTEEIVYYICDRVLKDSVLDVFYLISTKDGGISKIDILREYQSSLGIDLSSRKFRYTVDEAVATLIGTTFIDFFKDGTADKYFLTKNGEVAAELMGRLIQEKPDLLKTSKIVSAVMKNAAI